MAFEVYVPRSRGNEKKPELIVKISKNSIVLTKPVREKMQNPEHIELAYDSDSKTIRIKSVTKDQGIQMRKTKIYAKGFLEHFGINRYGKYFCEYNEDGNAGYVTL